MPSDTSILQTELRNPRSSSIDTVSTLQLCHIIHTEDSTIATSIEPCLPVIADAIDSLANVVRNGGRVLYVGAGTSGRLGVLDASEIPPTFSSTPGQFVGIIAGGDASLRSAQEGAEDSPERGVVDLQRDGIEAKDALIGIASSGRTPYVLGCLEYGKGIGSVTVGIACVKPSAMRSSGLVDFMIEAVTGPEVVTGSTRMKAGTATKMILNMLSTGTMIKLGKTYGNIMIDVKPTNVKLQERARRIIRSVCGTTRQLSGEEIDAALVASRGSVKVAAVSLTLDIGIEEAKTRLERNNGVVALVLQPPPNNQDTNDETKYSLCIDAGGTKCKAVLLNQHGDVFEGESGPCNIASSGIERTMGEIRKAIMNALQQPELDVKGAQITRACCGVAGSELPALRRLLQASLQDLLPYCQESDLRVSNDIELLATVAFEENPEVSEVIVLLSGTGSIAMRYRRSPHGPSLTGRTGGWGAFLGDDGSGYDIGRQALRLALTELQNNSLGLKTERADPLVTEILRLYGAQDDTPTLYNLLGPIVLPTSETERGDNAKQRVASCARLVLDMTERSKAAKDIVQNALRSLTELVKPLRQSQESRDTIFVLSGGVMRSSSLRNNLVEALEHPRFLHIDEAAVKVARILHHGRQVNDDAARHHC